MRIFGANSFREIARRSVGRHTGPIDDSRRPWRREGAWILDRVFELHVLALVVQIGYHSGVISDHVRILFRASLQGMHCGLVVDVPNYYCRLYIHLWYNDVV